MHKNLKLLSSGEACKLLNISRSRLGFLIEKYKIPHHQTGAGKIFEKEDLIAFQKSRADKMKHARKK